jgi:hypothetical protein
LVLSSRLPPNERKVLIPRKKLFSNLEHRAFKSFKPLTQLEGGARRKGREEGEAERRWGGGW